MKHSMKNVPSSGKRPESTNWQESAKKPELVYERYTVAPGSTSDYPEIGYNYTVSFDITGAKESAGTELFRSPNAVFYLSLIHI